MKKIFNKEIDQLLLSVDFIERKFKKYYFVLGNIQDKRESYILARNVFYFNLITEKIKMNFREIEINKRLIKSKKLKKEIKAKLKKNMKEKAMVATILLKELVALVKNYSMDKYDFEVQTLIDKNNIQLNTEIPENYKTLVLDEFEQINDNFNNSMEKFVNIEGFFKKTIKWFKDKYNKVKNFARNVIKKIGSFFTSFFNGLKSMLKILKKIGTFLLKNLFNFIKLMWKLLKGLMNFIIKWIPRFVKRFFSFWKLLYLKIKKTGPITVLMYAMFNILISKYWEILLGGGLSAPSMAVDYPTIFFTSHIFWTQTKALEKAQKQIFKFIAENLNVVKFFFLTILGLPKTNLFSARMPMRRRLALLFRYLKTNFTQLLFRLAIFLFLFKIFFIYSLENIVLEGTLDLRDYLLFPIIVIRFLLQSIF